MSGGRYHLRPRYGSRVTKSKLEIMPVEIVSMILCAIGDFDTLKNAIVSCHKLLSVFQPIRSLILSRVLDNFIHPDVQFEAIAAYTLSRLRISTSDFGDDLETDDEIAGRYHRMKVGFTYLNPLSPGFKEIIEKHEAVELLTTDMCGCNFHGAVAEGWMRPNIAYHSPSTIEMIRVQRALYRIDISGVLCHRRICPSTIRERFLLPLPPWEVEEMGCVYDTLAISMANSVKEAAESTHKVDVKYYSPLFRKNGKINHDKLDRWGNYHAMRGLDTIMSIHCASFGGLETREDAEFVTWLLQNPPGQKPNDGIYHLGPVLSRDPDTEAYVPSDDFSARLGRSDASGPNLVWHSIHKSVGDWTNWYMHDYIDLRDWFANIWDHDRLRSWGWSSESRPLKN